MSKELELARQLVKELEEKEKAKKVQLSELAPGDKFRTSIDTFIVLSHEGEKTKVISEKFYAEDECFDGDSSNYIESDLKKIFDEKITTEFEKIFGNDLVEHTVALKSVDMQDYGEFTCKVRPITFDEAREFNDLIVNTDLSGWCWTCTPWSTKERGWQYSVAVVSPVGSICNGCCNYRCGVHPVCILKSNIFVSRED